MLRGCCQQWLQTATGPGQPGEGSPATTARKSAFRKNKHGVFLLVLATVTYRAQPAHYDFGPSDQEEPSVDKPALSAGPR
jgi:hypothetical protein